MEYKRLYKIEADQITDCINLIQSFINKANEYEGDVFQIYNEMLANLKDGYVFGMVHDGCLLGLCSVHVFKIHNILKTAYVHFISIDDWVYGAEQVKEFISFAINEGKKDGIENIMFNTRRNWKAFKRFLPGKWEKDSVTLKLCV